MDMAIGFLYQVFLSVQRSLTSPASFHFCSQWLLVSRSSVSKGAIEGSRIARRAPRFLHQRRAAADIPKSAKATRTSLFFLWKWFHHQERSHSCLTSQPTSTPCAIPFT